MKTLQDWKESGEYVDFKGHRIFVRKAINAGPALVCVHGFPTASYDYHKIWDSLSEKFSMLSFDLIGYGFSDKPRDFSYTTNDQTDVLETVLRTSNIKRFHVLTHDYGNTILQEYLSRFLDSGSDPGVESICMLNGALFPETHRPILAQKLLIGPIGRIFARMIPEAAFRRSLASVFGANTQPSKKEINDYMVLLNHNGGRQILNLLIQYMREREIYRERWVNALQTIEVPFRFINGLDDPVSGKHLVERFREVVPMQKDIVELEDTGHFPHFERPQRTLEALEEFYQRLI